MEGEFVSDDNNGSSRYNRSKISNDCISSNSINDGSEGRNSKTNISSSPPIHPGSEKLGGRLERNRSCETRRKSIKTTVAADFGLVENERASVVEFQHSSMAKPLKKRFLQKINDLSQEDWDCKPSSSAQMEEGIQDRFVTPAKAAANRRFDKNDKNMIRRAADCGKVSQSAKRMKNRSIQMQKDPCRETDRDASCDPYPGVPRNSIFSVESTLPSPLTTNTAAASASAAFFKADAVSGSNGAKRRRSAKQKQSFESQSYEREYESSFSNKEVDSKIASAAASFATPLGALKDVGAAKDSGYMKLGTKTSENAPMGKKKNRGAGKKQQSDSRMCSRASQINSDDPDYPYFNYGKLREIPRCRMKS